MQIDAERLFSAIGRLYVETLVLRDRVAELEAPLADGEAPDGSKPFRPTVMRTVPPKEGE